VPGPRRVGTVNTTLLSVAAIRAARAWAVGQESNGDAPLLLRWNGTAWRKVVPPAGIGSATLTDVSFHGAKRGWAVGQTGQAPVVLRWADGEWTSDPPAEGSARMAAVEVLAGRTVAVGVLGSQPYPVERCD
jgi:hypothetical protein